MLRRPSCRDCVVCLDLNENVKSGHVRVMRWNMFELCSAAILAVTHVLAATG